MSGSTAYVADDDSGFHIIDVSDPTSPSLLGNYDTLASAKGVVVSGTTAYVAGDYLGLQIIDVGQLVFCGTPAMSCIYTINITASDRYGGNATDQFRITVENATANCSSSVVGSTGYSTGVLDSTAAGSTATTTTDAATTTRSSASTQASSFAITTSNNLSSNSDISGSTIASTSTPGSTTVGSTATTTTTSGIIDSLSSSMSLSSSISNSVDISGTSRGSSNNPTALTSTTSLTSSDEEVSTEGSPVNLFMIIGIIVCAAVSVVLVSILAVLFRNKMLGSKGTEKYMSDEKDSYGHEELSVVSVGEHVGESYDATAKSGEPDIRERKYSNFRLAPVELTPRMQHRKLIGVPSTNRHFFAAAT